MGAEEMDRSPAVAGQFYPASRDVLLEDLGKFMQDDVDKKDAYGVMAPHAGYRFSGSTAGKVFSRINPAGTCILLGPNHHGVGPDFSLYSVGSWRTPLGDVPVNESLAQKILDESSLIEEDTLAHQREHSIEVQLPFLQYLKEDIQIIPIAVKHPVASEGFLGSCREVAEDIAEVVSANKLDVSFVASSDLTHYEPLKQAKKKDHLALEAIEQLDTPLLFERIIENDITMCGYGPVSVVVEASKVLGAQKGNIIDYTTSGDSTGDYGQVVGYGGVLIE